MRHTLIAMSISALAISGVHFLVPVMPIGPGEFAGLAALLFLSLAALGHALVGGRAG